MNLPEIDVDKIADSTLAYQITRLLNIIEEQAKQITFLQCEVQQLKDENARLKGQPKRPHYQDRKTSIRGTTDKSVTSLLNQANGSSEWKKGTKRGRLEIDEHIRLEEESRCACGGTDFQILRTLTKIIQGLQLIRHNTAYHGRDKKCRRCGIIIHCHFPTAIAGLGFDQTIASLASLFKFDCRMTHPLMHRLFTGLGIHISAGQINAMIMHNSQKLSGSYHHLKQVGFKRSRYLQSDATGAKRKDKKTQQIINQHAHIIGNKYLSIFCFTRYYNIPTMKRILTKRVRDKPFVSDDGSPNGEGLWITIKQLCWVHEIRLYKKLFPFFNGYQKLQQKVLSDWRTFYHQAKAYGEDPTERKKQEISTLFDTITTQHTDYDELNKQLLLTRKKRTRLLAFLDHPYLPIHNNQCEQDLREFVIIRKISGETKSVGGDRSLERHLSIIQTARKQGRDVFQTLHGILTGTMSPKVLTQAIC
jgi:VanZ family protein